MKHAKKVVMILLGMFFITQLIGIAVIAKYNPEVQQVVNDKGQIVNQTTYHLPYGTDPPTDIDPGSTFISIIISIAIAVILMLVLMKYKAELFLRTWFFVVVTFALAVTINAFIDKIPHAQLIAVVIALPLSAIKLFKRNIYMHNFTELLIYPGIAAIFVPLLIDKNGWLVNKLSFIFPKITEITHINTVFSIWPVVILLILISIYDIYAVWHAGFMQKMAQYQIKKLKFFTGFFVPYLGKKDRIKINQASTKGATLDKIRNKKIKVNVAILGGGDVVFPIILAGVVFNSLGFVQSLIISIGATIALAWLFYISKKGKFYPAMPFISVGCLIALGLALLI